MRLGKESLRLFKEMTSLIEIQYPLMEQAIGGPFLGELFTVRDGLITATTISSARYTNLLLSCRAKPATPPPLKTWA